MMTLQVTALNGSTDVVAGGGVTPYNGLYEEVLPERVGKTVC